MSNHAYADHALDYIAKGYNVVPGKRGSKSYAFKGLNQYAELKVDESQALTWISELKESNIDLMLGKVSGVVALDFDCVDPEIIKIIEPLLPKSKAGKIGSKGWTRFFRYNGEKSQTIKHNGEVVFEVLSDGKKTTMPGSRHPSGIIYKWENESLLTFDPNDFDYLPPFLIPHIESKLRTALPNAEVSGGKIISGRNDALSSLCGVLIKDGVSVDEAVRRLIEHDEEHNVPPLFSDETEMLHTERFTNALQFYSNHLTSVNGKRFRGNKAYEIPITASAVDHVHKEEILGKSEAPKENQGNSESIELPTPEGALKNIMDHILENSFVKQPNFAFSASLVLMSTIIGRKVVFMNNAPNLYALNIAPSGSGKDAPQQCIKNVLLQLRADSMLGAGDYVSDASLTDGLELNPVRLDIIDEAGGVLKAVNTGGATYNTKMADILCELYTSSHSRYLGRMVAEGRKGAANRPNVNLLMSTTPRGFEEAVTLTAIEKGLLGRVLMFNGDSQNPAARLKTFPRLDADTIAHLRYWLNFMAPSTDMVIGETSQTFLELKVHPNAEHTLDLAFEEFDNFRRETDKDDPLLPIISRLFQQLCKIAAIHACSRTITDPEVCKRDVLFGKKVALYNYEQFRSSIYKHIHYNKHEANMKKVLDIIQSSKKGVSRRKIASNTKWLGRKNREEILQDLIENGLIYVTNEKGKELWMAAE